MDKPYSPAADRNKEPIAGVLKKYIKEGTLLEVGTGTAQHAVYMAKLFPQLQWITTDQPEYHAGIKLWLDELKLPNLAGPLKFTVGEDAIPIRPLDYLYTSNTLHIMSWEKVQKLIQMLGQSLNVGAYVFIYGPFNYHGKFTSDSNAKFDVSLKSRDPLSGIRNFEDIKRLMQNGGFNLIEDHEMPANNRLLVFTKIKESIL